MSQIILPPQYGPSREWQIDQRVKELIAIRLTNHRFTREQERELDRLTDERIKLMGGRPSTVKKRSRPPLLSFFRW